MSVSIDQHWADLRIRLLNDGLQDEDVEAFRYAFYSGASVVFDNLNAAMRGETLPYQSTRDSVLKFHKESTQGN